MPRVIPSHSEAPFVLPLAWALATDSVSRVHSHRCTAGGAPPDMDGREEIADWLRVRTKPGAGQSREVPLVGRFSRGGRPGEGGGVGIRGGGCWGAAIIGPAAHVLSCKASPSRDIARVEVEGMAICEFSGAPQTRT